MSEPDGRLRRLIAGDLGTCRTEDVEDRLGELRELERRALGDAAAADVPVLSALAGDTRYRLVRLLRAAEDELCVCELAPLFDVSESAVSHALSDLAAAGLVDRRKDGRWRFYRSTPRADRLLDALDATREGAGE